ncbi:uncharacterized protein LOC127464607 isoform X5 [Manacus candei]|uniref:uncharacterized protein LOC127464607 isoform X5 n=1 Tax=Manacus candei TaxID=415023 RepID=UPI002225DCBB|nr:uncharacterized protein LOC127464607 isoform X5 [Manacus candei]
MRINTPSLFLQLYPLKQQRPGILTCMEYWESDWQFQHRISKNEQQPFYTGNKALTILTSGAVGRPAWALLRQQELSGVLPFVWEESSSVFNFGSWTAPFGSRSPAGSHQPFSPGGKALTFLVSGAVGGPAWTLAGQQELCVVSPLIWEESSSVWNFGSWTAHFGSRIAARCSWWASQGSPWAARALCAGTFCLGGILLCIQFWDLDWQFQCRTPASEQQPFLPGASGGPAWALLKQQELSGVLPFVWEESSSVFNFGSWTAPFGSRSPAGSHQPFSPGGKALTFLVSGAVGGPARAVHGQQELSVLAPFVWEESSSVFNSGTWTGNFSAGLLQANNSPFSQARKCLPSGSQVQLVGQPGQSMGSKSSLCWHLLSGRNPRLYSILGLGLAFSVQDSCKRTTALSPRQESAYPQGLRCSCWASQGSPWAARALCGGTFYLGGILLCIQFWESDWRLQRRTSARELQPFSPRKKVLTFGVSGAVGGPAWTLAGQQELSVLAPLVWEESSSVCHVETWTGSFRTGLKKTTTAIIPRKQTVEPLAFRCSWWASQGSPWAARALCAGTFCLGGILVCIQFWDLDWQFQCRTPASEQQPFLPGKKVLTLRVSGAVGGLA